MNYFISKICFYTLIIMSLFSCQNKDGVDSWLNNPEKIMPSDAKVITQWLLDNNFKSELFKISNNDYHSGNNSILVKNKQVHSIAASGVSTINALNNLTELTELNLRKIKLSNLIGCPSTLEKIEINGNLSSLKGLKSCKNIVNLKLFHSNIKDLHQISNLINLKKLEVAFSSYYPDSLSFSLLELTHLTLRDSNIEKTGQLGPFNKLEYLNLKNNKLTADINVSAFPHLINLDLSNNQISVINYVSTSIEEINLLKNNIKDISILTQWKSLKKIIYRPIQSNLPEQLIRLIDGRYTKQEDLIAEAQKLKKHYLNQVEFIEKMGSQPSGRATGIKNHTSTSAGLHSDIKISGTIQIDQLEKFMQLKIVTFDDILYYDKHAPISGKIKIESGRIKVYSPMRISFWNQALLYANKPLSTPSPDPSLELEGYEIKEYHAGEAVDFKAVLKPYAGIYMLLISAEGGDAKGIKITLD